MSPITLTRSAAAAAAAAAHTPASRPPGSHLGRRTATKWEQVPDRGPAPVEQFEAEFERRWQQVALEEALEAIRREVEPVTHQAFDLHVRKGVSVREVAKLLGVSRNVVYVSKSRMLARLRNHLGPGVDPARLLVIRGR